jgi:hypothetical protein
MSDPIGDLKRELLAAAVRQHGSARTATGSWGRMRAPRRVLLVGASVSIVAALALALGALWSDSPGLLEKAQAALTAPPETIQYARWEVISTSTEAGCTVTRGPSEGWTDTVPPYRWRVLLRDLPLTVEDAPPDISKPDCWKGVTSELGGTGSPVCTATGCEPMLHFVAPNSLRVAPIWIGLPHDPVQSLRDAIDHGLAHDEAPRADGRKYSPRPTARLRRRARLSRPDARLRRPRDPLPHRDPQPRVPRRALRRPLPHVRVPAANPRQPRAHRHPSPAPERGRDRNAMTPAIWSP